MRRLIVAALAVPLLAMPLLASAKLKSSTSSHSSHDSSSSSHASSHSSHTSNSLYHAPSSHHAPSSSTKSSHGHTKADLGVHRDSHGKIARDPRQLNAFKKQHPCPVTGKTYGACPGYVVDHKQALKHGGADAPYNMQWKTTEQAKIKDRTE